MQNRKRKIVPKEIVVALGTEYITPTIEVGLGDVVKFVPERVVYREIKVIQDWKHAPTPVSKANQLKKSNQKMSTTAKRNIFMRAQDISIIANAMKEVALEAKVMLVNIEHEK